MLLPGDGLCDERQRPWDACSVAIVWYPASSSSRRVAARPISKVWARIQGQRYCHKEITRAHVLPVGHPLLEERMERRKTHHYSAGVVAELPVTFPVDAESVKIS